MVGLNLIEHQVAFTQADVGTEACLRIPGEVARESAMMSPSIPI
jgi:hypothetical protein